MDDLIIIKVNAHMKNKDYIRIKQDVEKNSNKRVILLPPYCEVVLGPNTEILDIGERFTNEIYMV